MAEDMDLNEDFIGLDIELNVNLESAEENIRQAIAALNESASRGGIDVSISDTSANNINSLSSALNKLGKVDFDAISSGIKSVNSAIGSLKSSTIIDISISGNTAEKLQDIYDKLNGFQGNTQSVSSAFEKMANDSIVHIERQSGAIDKLMSKMRELSLIKMTPVDEYSKTTAKETRSPVRTVAGSAGSAANVDLTGLSKKQSKELLGVVNKFMSSTTSEVFNGLNVSGFSLKTSELGSYNPLTNKIAINMKNGAESALKTLFHEATHQFIKNGLEVDNRNQLIEAVRSRLLSTKKKGSSSLRQIADRVGLVYQERFADLDPKHIEEVIAHAVAEISQTGNIKAFGPEIEKLVKRAFNGIAESMYSIENSFEKEAESRIQEINSRLEKMRAADEAELKSIAEKRKAAGKGGWKKPQATKEYEAYKDQTYEEEKSLLGERAELERKLSAHKANSGAAGISVANGQIAGIDRDLQDKIENLSNLTKAIDRAYDKALTELGALEDQLKDPSLRDATFNENGANERIAEIKKSLENMDDQKKAAQEELDKIPADLRVLNSVLEEAFKDIIVRVSETQDIILQNTEKIAILNKRIEAAGGRSKAIPSDVAELAKLEKDTSFLRSDRSRDLIALRSTGIRGEATNSLANTKADELEMSLTQAISEVTNRVKEVKVPESSFIQLSKEIEELKNKIYKRSDLIDKGRNVNLEESLLLQDRLNEKERKMASIQGKKPLLTNDISFSLGDREAEIRENIKNNGISLPESGTESKIVLIKRTVEDYQKARDAAIKELETLQEELVQNKERIDDINSRLSELSVGDVGETANDGTLRQDRTLKEKLEKELRSAVERSSEFDEHELINRAREKVAQTELDLFNFTKGKVDTAIELPSEKSKTTAKKASTVKKATVERATKAAKEAAKVTLVEDVKDESVGAIDLANEATLKLAKAYNSLQEYKDNFNKATSALGSQLLETFEDRINKMNSVNGQLKELASKQAVSSIAPKAPETSSMAQSVVTEGSISQVSTIGPSGETKKVSGKPQPPIVTETTQAPETSETRGRGRKKAATATTSISEAATHAVKIDVDNSAKEAIEALMNAIDGRIKQSIKGIEGFTTKVSGIKKAVGDQGSNVDEFTESFERLDKELQRKLIDIQNFNEKLETIGQSIEPQKGFIQEFTASINHLATALRGLKEAKSEAGKITVNINNTNNIAGAMDGISGTAIAASNPVGVTPSADPVQVATAGLSGAVNGSTIVQVGAKRGAGKADEFSPSNQDVIAAAENATNVLYESSTVYQKDMQAAIDRKNRMDEIRVKWSEMRADDNNFFTKIKAELKKEGKKGNLPKGWKENLGKLAWNSPEFQEYVAAKKEEREALFSEFQELERKSNLDGALDGEKVSSEKIVKVGNNLYRVAEELDETTLEYKQAVTQINEKFENLDLDNTKITKAGAIHMFPELAKNLANSVIVQVGELREGQRYIQRALTVLDGSNNVSNILVSDDKTKPGIKRSYDVGINEEQLADKTEVRDESQIRLLNDRDQLAAFETEYNNIASQEEKRQKLLAEKARVYSSIGDIGESSSSSEIEETISQYKRLIGLISKFGDNSNDTISEVAGLERVISTLKEQLSDLNRQEKQSNLLRERSERETRIREIEASTNRNNKRDLEILSDVYQDHAGWLKRTGLEANGATESFIVLIGAIKDLKEQARQAGIREARNRKSAAVDAELEKYDDTSRYSNLVHLTPKGGISSKGMHGDAPVDIRTEIFGAYNVKTGQEEFQKLIIKTNQLGEVIDKQIQPIKNHGAAVNEVAKAMHKSQYGQDLTSYVDFDEYGQREVLRKNGNKFNRMRETIQEDGSIREDFLGESSKIDGMFHDRGRDTHRRIDEGFEQDLSTQGIYEKFGKVLGNEFARSYGARVTQSGRDGNVSQDIIEYVDALTSERKVAAIRTENGKQQLLGVSDSIDNLLGKLSTNSLISGNDLSERVLQYKSDVRGQIGSLMDAYIGPDNFENLIGNSGETESSIRTLGYLKEHIKEMGKEAGLSDNEIKNFVEHISVAVSRLKEANREIKSEERKDRKTQEKHADARNAAFSALEDSMAPGATVYRSSVSDENGIITRAGNHAGKLVELQIKHFRDQEGIYRQAVAVIDKDTRQIINHVEKTFDSEESMLKEIDKLSRLKDGLRMSSNKDIRKFGNEFHLFENNQNVAVSKNIKDLIDTNNVEDWRALSSDAAKNALPGLTKSLKESEISVKAIRKNNEVLEKIIEVQNEFGLSYAVHRQHRDGTVEVFDGLTNADEIRRNLSSDLLSDDERRKQQEFLSNERISFADKKASESLDSELDTMSKRNLGLIGDETALRILKENVRELEQYATHSDIAAKQVANLRQSIEQLSDEMLRNQRVAEASETDSQFDAIVAQNGGSLMNPNGPIKSIKKDSTTGNIVEQQSEVFDLGDGRYAQRIREYEVVNGQLGPVISSTIRPLRDQAEALRAIGENANQTNKNLLTFIGHAARNILIYGGLYNVFFTAQQAFVGMINKAGELEQKRYDIIKILDERQAEFSNQSQREGTSRELQNKATEISNIFGKSSQDVMDVERDFIALYKNKEQAIFATVAATKLAVATNIELTDSSKVLVSISEQFGLSARGLDDFVDSLNQATNLLPTVRADDLVANIQRVGPLAEQAGVSVDKTIALTALGMQKFGANANEIGNSLKTFFAFLGESGKKDALADFLGVDTFALHGVTVNETIDKIQSRVKALQEEATNLSKNGREAEAALVRGKVRDFFTEFGGAHQAARMAATFSDKEGFNDLYDSNTGRIRGAQGSAAKEAAIVLQSFENTKNRFIQNAANTGALITEATLPALKELMEGGIAAFSAINNNRASLEAGVKTTVEVFKTLGSVIGGVFNGLGQTLQSVYVLFLPIIETVKLFDFAMRTLEDTTNRFIGGIARMVGMEYPFDPATRSANGLNKALGETLTIVTQLGATMALSQLLTGAINLPGRNNGNRTNNRSGTGTNDSQNSNPASSLGGTIAGGAVGTLIGNVADNALENMFNLDNIPERDFDEYRRQSGTNVSRRGRRGRNFRNQNNDSGVDSLTSASTSLSDIFKRLNPDVSALTAGFGGLLNVFKNFVAGINPATITITAILAVANHFYKKIKETVDMLKDGEADADGNKFSKAALISMEANDALRESRSIDAKPRQDKDGNVILTPEQESRQRIDNAISALEEKQRSGVFDRADATRLKDLRNDKKAIASKDKVRRDAEKELEKAINWKDKILQNIHVFGGEGSHWYTDALKKVEEKNNKLKEVLNSNKDAVDAMVKAAGDVAKSDSDLKIEEAALQSSVDEFKKVKDKLKFSKFIENAKKRFEEIVDAGQAGELSSVSGLSAMRTTNRQNTQTFAPFKQLFEDELVKVNKRIESFSITGKTEEEREKQQQEFNELLNQQQTIEGNLASIRQQEISERRKILELQEQIRREGIESYRIEAERRKLRFEFFNGDRRSQVLNAPRFNIDSLNEKYREYISLNANRNQRIKDLTDRGTSLGVATSEVNRSMSKDYMSNARDIESAQLNIKNSIREATEEMFSGFSGQSDLVSGISSVGENGYYKSAIQSELELVKLRKQIKEETISAADFMRQSYEIALNNEIKILDLNKQRRQLESRTKFAYSSLYGEYGRTGQSSEESRLNIEDLNARKALVEKSLTGNFETMTVSGLLDGNAKNMAIGSSELDQYLKSQKDGLMGRLQGIAGNSPRMLGLTKEVEKQLYDIAIEETNAISSGNTAAAEEAKKKREAVIEGLPGIKNNKEMQDVISSLSKIAAAQEAINKLRAISLGITEEEVKQIQNSIDVNNQNLEIENKALRLKKQGADIAISRSDLTGNRIDRLSATSYSFDTQLSELENNKKGIEFERATKASTPGNSTEKDNELLRLTNEINVIDNQIKSLKLDKIKAVRSEISEIIRESAEAQSDMRDISDLRIGIQENIADMSGDNGILSQSIFSQQRKSVKIGRLNDQISDLESQRQIARILGNKTEEARIDRSILKLQLEIEGVENELNPLQRQLVDIAKDFGDNFRNAFATAFSKALASPDLEKIKDIELNIKDINLQRDDYRRQLRDLDTAAMDSIAPPDEVEKMRREAYDRMEQRNRIAEQDAIKAEELRKKERELAEERNPLLKFGRTLREEQDKNRQESTERLLNVAGEVGFDALTNPAKAQELADMMKSPEKQMQDASVKQFSAAEIQAEAAKNFNLGVSRLIEAINTKSSSQSTETGLSDLVSRTKEAYDSGKIDKDYIITNYGKSMLEKVEGSGSGANANTGANAGTETSPGVLGPQIAGYTEYAFKDTGKTKASEMRAMYKTADLEMLKKVDPEAAKQMEEARNFKSQPIYSKGNSSTQSGTTIGNSDKTSEFLSNYGMSGYMGKGLINTGIGLTSAIAQMGNGQPNVAGINIAGAIASPLVSAGSEEMLKMWAGDDKDKLAAISNPLNGAAQMVGGQLGGVLSQLNRQGSGVAEDQRSEAGKASAGIGGAIGSTAGAALFQLIPGLQGPLGAMLGSAVGGFAGDVIGEWAGDWLGGGNQEKQNKANAEKAEKDLREKRELENKKRYEEEVARANEYLTYQKSMVEWQRQAAENAKQSARAIQATGETFKSAGELIQEDVNLFGASSLISGRFGTNPSHSIINDGQTPIHAANGAYLPDSEKYNGIPATLHKGELVLPREISQGMIDIIRNNGVGAKDASSIARSYVSDYRSNPYMDAQREIQQAFGNMVLPELRAKVIADVQMPDALPEMQVDVNARLNMPEIPKQDMNINVNNNNGQSGSGGQGSGGSGMTMSDIERQNQINRSRGLS